MNCSIGSGNCLTFVNSQSNLIVLKNTAILLIHCPDQKGIVSIVSEFIYKNDGNMVNLEQHIETESSTFFMRAEWELEGFAIPQEKISEYFSTLIGEKYNMTFELKFSINKPRMAIFVSKMSHCLFDILGHHKSGVLNVDIPLLISNHAELGDVAEKFGIDYKILPITKENKAEQEAIQKSLLEEYQIDFCVLARYMQILSEDFIKEYKNRIINIHHSFLPAFAGAKPYHAAYARGVKIIGATSHYVTEELDAGPIIEQDVVRVTHKSSIKDLVRKGQDLEKIVLSRAIYNHIQHKVLVFNNRTIIFD